MTRLPHSQFSNCIIALTIVLTLTLPTITTGQEKKDPIVESNTHFNEQNGFVAVEAEHFIKQTETDKRAFYLTNSDTTPKFDMDGDPAHVGGASNGAYLEILPDTRRNHGQKLIRGTNFSNEPGKVAILQYQVNFTNAGRYYVWVRAHSTGSEDNGLHVGIDGTWPESGMRLQWCEGKRQWWWESKQRTAKAHCGEPHKIFLDITKPGIHTIHFSMREDGFEFDQWLMTKDRDFKRPAGIIPSSTSNVAKLPTFPLVAAPKIPAVPAPVADPSNSKNGKAATNKQGAKSEQSNGAQESQAGNRDHSTSPTKPVSNLPLIQPRQPHGNGEIKITGDLMAWHKVTLTMNGPYAHEQDNSPNPFTDYRMEVDFTHADGTKYRVPGFFAADGNASESSADSGTKWRAHFAPDRAGDWSYSASIKVGKLAAINQAIKGDLVTLSKSNDGNKTAQKTGTFTVQTTDKSGRDLRAHGRLKYVGKHYLQHIGSKRFFLKAGADAPETLFGYADFDNTIAGKSKRVPLKTFAAHVDDWNASDPTWKSGKGKGLIGAINYLSSKGCNAFSFLTYNAGGDGDNVWPFIDRNDKLHYDCSKLDQWAIVLDHATTKGMYLHFKMQENENDDHRAGQQKKESWIPTSLDGGNLGIQRKLYIRELVARFGHNLALNWNLGEENTQTNEQQIDMIKYIGQVDPYDHHIVVHTYPNQQDKIYGGLAGEKSGLTGASLQNGHIKDTHWQTVKWVRSSSNSGKPWVIAFDESGSAAHGQCPDLGYRGFEGKDKTGEMIYNQHAVRRLTLWGTIMGGGAGVEYYFGYKFVENDLVCEDWRSRDQSWDYCRICLNFFSDNDIPIQDMKPADELVGNPKHENSKYCFAKPGEIYLVYLPKGGDTEIDLSGADGEFSVSWFNPRNGEMKKDVAKLTGGNKLKLDSKMTDGEDWLAMIRKSK